MQASGTWIAEHREEEAFLFRQSISPKLQADWQLASVVVTAMVGDTINATRAARKIPIATTQRPGQMEKKK